MPKTWLITGCSTGFGRALARHLLEIGENVVITARDPEKAADLAAGHEDRTLLLRLDVRDRGQIDEAVRQAEARFGGIDVLVNNAGYGYYGAVEESDAAAGRTLFDVNVWGLLEMTQAVLPGMRRRRTGTIVNISSIGGIRAMATLSLYNASKHAVEAISESLSKEVAPLGIKVLIVEPSGFRTEFANSAGETGSPVDDYAATAGKARRIFRGLSGRQPGDPDRAARAIVMAVNAENPPLRLLLGKAAVTGAREKIEELRRDFDAWAKVAEEADFPEGS